MQEDERFQALERTLSNIHKRYGEGAIMRMGRADHLHVEAIPTGSLALDLALGVGGVPRGRVTEIYGSEGSGKTTLCQHLVAEAQRMGGVAAFIDMEHALDPVYAAKCGVDVDELYISQPDTGEQALEIAEALVRSGAVDVIVLDSVAALVPRAEIEGEMGDSHPGLQARLMSQALRKLSGAIKASNTAMVFTNQLRQRIGVMYGSPETTSGGMALKFYSSVRMDIRRIQPIKAGGEIVGNRTRVRVKKNKVAPPFRQCEFDIMYDGGISKEGDLLDLGVELGLIEKRGSYYLFRDDRLAQGRENTKQVLREDANLCAEVEDAIRREVGLAEVPPSLPSHSDMPAPQESSSPDQSEALLTAGSGLQESQLLPEDGHLSLPQPAQSQPVLSHQLIQAQRLELARTESPTALASGHGFLPGA